MNLPSDASTDQSNVPQDYYRRTNGMLHQIQATTAQQSPSDAIDPETLSSLQTMPKDALISLIQRVSGAMWGVGLKTKEEIAEAFKLKLAIGGMNEKDMFKALPIMREWFDREMGKAAQSIAMTVEDKGLGKLSDERLLRLEQELAKMTGLEAVLIPPQPKKLDIDNSNG